MGEATVLNEQRSRKEMVSEAVRLIGGRFALMRAVRRGRKMS